MTFLDSRRWRDITRTSRREPQQGPLCCNRPPRSVRLGGTMNISVDMQHSRLLCLSPPHTSQPYSKKVRYGRLLKNFKRGWGKKGFLLRQRPLLTWWTSLCCTDADSRTCLLDCTLQHDPVNRTQPTHSTTGECLTNHCVFSRQGRLMLIPQRDDLTAAALSLSALLWWMWEPSYVHCMQSVERAAPPSLRRRLHQTSQQIVCAKLEVVD